MPDITELFDFSEYEGMRNILVDEAISDAYEERLRWMKGDWEGFTFKSSDEKTEWTVTHEKRYIISKEEQEMWWMCHSSSGEYVLVRSSRLLLTLALNVSRRLSEVTLERNKAQIQPGKGAS